MLQTLATLATLACARAWPALDEALMLPDAQFERGSIGEYKPRSGCSPLHGGCAWMRTGHSTQRARAAKHLGGK